MTQGPLVLYRCGWTARPTELYYTLRHPPVPNLMNYWLTGQAGDGSHDTYVGIVAVPVGVDPMTVVRQEFFDVVDRGMTRLYVYGEGVNDRFTGNGVDWYDQRLIYHAATGNVWIGPIIGHYSNSPPDDQWWCTTTTEFFDL